MKCVIYLLLVFAYCLQTSFASPALKTQLGAISNEKCKEYSTKNKKCGHTTQELTKGVKIAEENEFPHMALIGYDKENNEKHWACEGSLISDQYVITAAHCLVTKHTGNAKYVKIGVNNLNDNSKAQEFKIIAQIQHPDFKPMSFYNDIGLVKLDKKIEFSENALPACLNSNTGLNVQKAILSGFDRTRDEFKTKREKLKKAVVEIKSEQECSHEYNTENVRIRLSNGINHKSQFCGAVFSGEKEVVYNSLSGDPLQIYHNEEDGVKCMYDIIGFATFGKGFNNYPEVFTRISNYIGWIESVVWA